MIRILCPGVMRPSASSCPNFFTSWEQQYSFGGSSGKFSGDHWIGCPRRDSQIILQNIPVVVLALYQVDARYMRVDILDRGHTLALRHVTAGGKDEVLRHHAVLHDFLFRIDILQEQIKRHYPLFQTLFQIIKFFLFNDTWNRIKREKLLLKGIIFIYSSLLCI